MQHRDQEVLIDVSTAAMDTGGYGVLLTVTAEGGTEVDAAFSRNCASLDEARDRAELFAQNWVEENIASAETMQKGVRSRIGLCGHGAWLEAR